VKILEGTAITISV